MDEILNKFHFYFETFTEYATVFDWIRTQNCLECEELFRKISDTLVKRQEQTMLDCQSLSSEIERKTVSLERDSITFLLYFLGNSSGLFHAYIKEQMLIQLRESRLRRLEERNEEEEEEFEVAEEHLLRESVSLSQINQVLQATKERLLDVLTSDDLKLSEIDKAVKLMKQHGTQKEMNAISNFPFFKEKCGDSLGERLFQLEKCLTLASVADSLPKIISAIETNGLADKEDTVLKYLKQEKQVLDIDSRKNISLREASERLKQFKEKVNLDEQHLNFFERLNDYAQLVSFLKNNEFYADKKFEHFKQLITQDFQGENKFNNSLLNDLINTQRFFDQIISAIESKIGLESFIKIFQVVQIPEINCLDSVKHNLDEIRDWVEKLKPGSVSESAQKICEALLGNGKCHILLKNRVFKPIDRVHDEEDSQVKNTYFVRYCIDMIEQKVDTEGKSSARKKLVQLSSERIEEYVCKWTIFANTTKEHKIVHDFIEKHKVVLSIYQLLCNMQASGHPTYQSCEKIIDLNKFSVKELCSFHKKFSAQLEDWKSILSQLKRQKELLLFFDQKQILKMLSLVHSNEIERLRSYLFIVFGSFTPSTKEIKQVIESKPISSPLDSTSLESDLLADSLTSDGVALNSIKELGQFLEDLRAKMSENGDKIEPLDFKVFPTERYSRDQACVFMAINATPEEVFRLIIFLYEKRPPQPKEVFFCSKKTTIEQLVHQMELMGKAKNARFTFVHVDKLGHKLRQELLNFQLRSSRRASINYIFTKERGSEVFSEWLPKIELSEHKTRIMEDPSFKESLKSLLQCKVSIVFVEGDPGDGKAHWINKQLKLEGSFKKAKIIYISVNEEFDVSKVIKIFRDEAKGQEKDQKFSVHFNISCFAPLGKLNHFFFFLILTNIISDSENGDLFSMENPSNWTFFVEIPSSTIKSGATIEEVNQFESVSLIGDLPSVAFSGNRKLVGEEDELEIGDDAREICPFLKAYLTPLPKSDRTLIDLNNDEVERMCVSEKIRAAHIVEFLEKKFANEFKLDSNCRKILKKIFESKMVSSKIGELKKMHQKFFVSFVKRRIDFLKNNYQFLFNNLGTLSSGTYKSYLKLGSILMEQMLNEADNFFNKDIRCNWSEYPHVYLVYDSQSFKVLALNKNDEQCKERIKMLESLEVGTFKDDKFAMIPERNELKRKTTLIKYLSIALNIHEDKVSSIINDSKYILTLDYTFKLIQVAERQRNKMPTIISGETGVGKSELIRIFSKLLNASKDFNPDATHEVTSWLKDKVIPTISKVDISVANECRKILDENTAHHERVAVVVGRLFEESGEQVLKLLFDWKEDYVDKRLEEVKEALLSDEIPKLFDLLKNTKLTGEQAGDIIKIIVSKEKLRIDLLSPLISKIEKFIEKSQTIEEKEKMQLQQTLLFADTESHFRLEKAFSLILNSKSKISKQLKSTFKTYLEDMINSKFSILKQTKTFSNCFESLKKDPEDADNIQSTLHELLSLKSREVYYKMAVHAGLKPKDIRDQLASIIESARECKDAGYIFTVFMDEAIQTLQNLFA